MVNARSHAISAAMKPHPITPNSPHAVYHAAHGSKKIAFPELIEQSAEAQDALLKKLAKQFRQREDGSLRRMLFGGESYSERMVARHTPTIRQQILALREQDWPGADGITTGLMQAVLAVETDYNGGSWAGSRTSPPMNINAGVWRHTLDAYNRSNPETPINVARIGRDPAENIKAAAVILSTINAAIEPALQGPMREAMIASIYGHTEITLRNERPIMYGAIVQDIRASRYPAPRPQRRAEAEMTSSDPVPIPTPAVAMPTRHTQRA